MKAIAAGMTLVGVLMQATAAGAAQDVYTITIRNHRFEPAEISIPAGRKVRLLVKNADPTPEEFESFELNREKIVSGGAEATIYVGPLDPGTYPFFGDFHQDTAKGRIVVR